MTETHAGSGRSDRSPYYTRFDAMYASLSLEQRLVLWVITTLLGLQLPPLMSSTLAQRVVLTFVFTIGSFMLLSALFSWFNER